MPKTPGFISFVCERCDAQTYAAEKSPTDQSWKTIEHVNADGSTNSRFLCPSCISEYRPLAQAHDEQFATFMAKGRGDDNDS